MTGCASILLARERVQRRSRNVASGPFYLQDIFSPRLFASRTLANAASRMLALPVKFIS